MAKRVPLKKSVSGKGVKHAATGLCLAPAHRKGGKPCTRRPVEGAAHCQFHGGLEEIGFSPDDPRLKLKPKGTPGRPPEHGLYRKYLEPEEMAAYDQAKVGVLDDEIKLAKANLSRLVSKRSGDADGGVTKLVGKQVVFMSWHDMILAQQDLVRRLEQTRSQYALAEGKSSGSGFTITVSPVAGVRLADVPDAGEGSGEEEY